MSQSELFSAILSEDDIKWQSIIYELIRSKKIDPWDIDIQKFANEYIETIKKLKRLNFRISGKVILSAALLLKIKTRHLGLDDFIMLTNDDEDNFEDGDFEFDEDEYIDPDEAKIMKLSNHIRHNTKRKYLIQHKTVTPRSRKVTVVELMGALKKAIEVDRRRETRRAMVEDFEDVTIDPEQIFEAKKEKITDRIKKIHSDVLNMYGKTNSHVDFDELVGDLDYKEKISIFLPLLHLANHGKVNIIQEKSFDKILLEVLKNGRY
ncbi:segregation/condensation protein A [Candidatus Woesearchaeota archaeon]|jgi:segregation and condensation protein A|nr:segregation/condensation protein A [Candidatus Woesearchaeota archaeon]MBT6023459.1 segregation/condensation protein A [Candidatus Woesearchaeota archaeon]